MSNYKKYPKYRDSGVEWLGEIPATWEIWKLNHFSLIITCGVASTPEYVDNGVKFLSAQNIINNKIDLRKGNKYITEKKHSELTNIRTVINGDLLMSRVGTIGNTCIVDVDFEFSIFVSLTHLRINNIVCNNTFFVYLTESKYFRELNASETLVGGGVGNLNVNDLREYKLPLPHLQEQQTIANYLDIATAKIDILIEKQTKLIELLREKRQAVISTAVTRGLDSTVAMKDSGVEWLGEIPEHWKVVGFKRYFKSIVDYRGKTPEKVDSGIFLVTARNIKKGEINYDASSEYVKVEDYDEIMSRGIPELGDVLFTTEAPLGEVANIDRTNIALAQRVIKFSGQDGILDNYYLKYFMMSLPFQNSLMIFATGSTALGIKAERLVYLRKLIPPYEEQQEIANYLDDKTSKIDNLITKATKAIDLLKEKRTALISSAVTGKIDVRGEAA